MDSKERRARFQLRRTITVAGKEEIVENELPAEPAFSNSMVTIHDQVTDFHRAFDQPIHDKPFVPSEDRLKLRGRLIMEEPLESLLALGAEPDYVLMAAQYIRAAVDSIKRERCNLVELADGLGDSDYVNEGTRLECGIPGRAVAAEIQRSNMAKLGPDGKPMYREDGKIMKPDGWTPPNIKGVLLAHGWEP